MFTNFKARFCLFFFGFFLINVIGFAQTVLSFDFRNDFDEQSNLVPPLNVLGTGAFTDESLPDLSCMERTVYGFTQNSGVQFDNGAAGNIIGDSYSIEAYFKFTANAGLIRLIDFKNRTSDFGLYASSTQLIFNNEFSVNTGIFTANEYVHMVITRNATSNNVEMYLNGMHMGGFTDSNLTAVPDASQLINFFQDDLVSGNEAQPGNIALLKLYTYEVDSNQVLSNYENLEETSGTLAFSSDTLATCFNGHVFSFTNISQPSGVITYLWEYGDGNSATGSPVSHSYLLPGVYSVYLIGDDGNGCIDTAVVDVEAYTILPYDLGSDFGVCTNEQALLDAGPGFISYLWSDNSTAQMLIANQPGTYTVTVTDSAGCSGTDSIIVFLNPDPIFDLGNDTTICFTASIFLNGPDSMETYLWSTGVTDEFIVVNTGGIFYLEVTNFEGCSASDTIVVTENPDIIISLGNDTSICDGQQLTLDPGSGFQSYQWNIGATSQTINVIATAQYFVTVTDSLGCTKTDDIFVNVLPTVVVDLGPDVSFCGGDSTILDAGPGFLSYLWSDGSTGQTLTVFSSGTYLVTVSNGLDCDGTDEIIVSANPFVTLGADFAFCVGDSVVLNPGPGYSSYLWSTGAVSQSILVTNPGTYTLTVTDGNGCINSDDIILSHLPQPMPAIADSLSICDGDTTVLDAGTGFINYLWNDGSATQTITVFTQGVYTVTVTDLLGCTGSGDLVLSLNNLTVLDLGPDSSICPGTFITLDGGAGLTSYLWNDGSTGQQLQVTLPGIYTLTVTDSLGCTGTDSITIGLFNNPVLNLGPDTVVCPGDSVLLDAGNGFVSYLWNDGSSAQSYYASLQGIYTVTVTDINGCNGNDDVQVSFFTPIPIPTITQIGNTLQSSAVSGNQWYNVPGGIIPGATNQTYDPPANGTYYVIVSDTNGCLSQPSSDFIFIMSGINEIGTMNFELFPNPSDGIIQLIVGDRSISNFDILIIDLSGKELYGKSFNNESIVSIDLSFLENGMYFVQLISDNSAGTKRVLIQKN